MVNLIISLHRKLKDAYHDPDKKNYGDIRFTRSERLADPASHVQDINEFMMICFMKNKQMYNNCHAIRQPFTTTKGRRYAQLSFLLDQIMK